jgi:hypothetical protein
LKTWPLNRKIDRLSEKLANPIHPEIRLDLDSFSESEKILFRRVDEIAEEYRQTGSAELLLENSDLISKNLEVFLIRVRELYCYAVPRVLGCGEADGVVEYFFRLLFYNFEADLTECLENVRSWSKEDREEFALYLKNNRAVFFRIPRGLSDVDDVEFENLDSLEVSVNKMEEKKENE